jgi:hypothetical protein
MSIVMKNKLIIATALIVLSVALVSPSFLMNNAIAAPTKSLFGISICNSQGTCGADAPTGSVTCPDGSKVPLLQTFFNAQKSSKTGQITGFFILTAEIAQLSVQINQAQISPNNFKMTGISLIEFCSPTGATAPVVSTLSGPCGQDVTVQYKSANEAGKITHVNVACT